MEHISIGAIRHFIEINAVTVYLIIFLGVILEGEIVVIFAGIFSHLSSINIFIAFFAIIMGGAMKSFLGYLIGSSLNKYHSHRNFIQRIELKMSSFLPHFGERPFWSIFISRFFVFGIGWFTLIFSGYKKVPIKVYIKAEVISLIIWSILMLLLGYFFSYTALSVSRDVRNFIGIILLFFILFFILEKVVAFILELFEIQRL